MANKAKKFFSSLSLKRFKAKHSKVINRTFLALLISGISAGIIAFAALMGIEPTNRLNINSFIGFLVFAFICFIGFSLWKAFGHQNRKASSSVNKEQAEQLQV